MLEFLGEHVETGRGKERTAWSLVWAATDPYVRAFHYQPDLTLPPPAEGSDEVARRVAAARAVQTQRYEDRGVRTNAEADGELLDTVATPDDAGRKLLADAAAVMRLSARGFHRVLRVARTIADLAGAERVGRIHVAEALSYRRQAPRN